MLASAVSRQAALNYPQRAALLKAQLEHRAFFTAQEFVDRSHRNALSPYKCCTSDLRPPSIRVVVELGKFQGNRRQTSVTGTSGTTVWLIAKLFSSESGMLLFEI